MRTLIRNGTIATDQKVFQGDILIRDGHIHAISERINATDAETNDATGKLVLLGTVDIHTHMDLDAGVARVIDDFYTGTVAATCGGTTAIVGHMAFGPKGCGPWHQVRQYNRLSDGNSDYSCYEGMQITDAVERVLLRGKTVALNGAFTGARGDGQYLRRGRSSLV